MDDNFGNLFSIYEDFPLARLHFLGLATPNNPATRKPMTFAIKAEVADPAAKTFAFRAQKMVYGGKQVARDDTIFVFCERGSCSR